MIYDIFNTGLQMIMTSLFTIQKSKDSIQYGKRLTSAQISKRFGISTDYCMTHSKIDHSTFLFAGRSVRGNVHTAIDPSGKVEIKTVLKANKTYKSEKLLPEETEIGDIAFIIEKQTARVYVYRGVAELDEIEIIKRERAGKGIWHLHCIIHGRIRDENNAYTFRTVDIDTLETPVYIPTPEGIKKAVYATKYERKKANRDAAIAVHGTVCMACGFDFEKVYGEYGKGFIEVHHTKPLFENDEEIIPDPQKDLICLCPNCHRMVHHFRNRVLSLEELKQIIEETQANNT